MTTYGTYNGYFEAETLEDFCGEVGQQHRFTVNPWASLRVALQTARWWFWRWAR